MLRKIKEFLFGGPAFKDKTVKDFHRTIIAYLNTIGLRIHFIDHKCKDYYNNFKFPDSPTDIIVVDGACTMKHVLKIIDLFRANKLNNTISVIFDEDLHFARPIVLEEIRFLKEIYPDLPCTELFELLLDHDNLEDLPRELLSSRKTYKSLKHNLCKKL